MTSTMFVDLCFASGIAMIGMVAGWWLRGRDNTAADSELGVHGLSEDDADSPTQRAIDALTRMQEMTASVAADVGVHNSRVRAISDELSTATGADGANVVAAIAKLIQANELMQTQLAEAEDRMLEQEKLIDCHVAEARTDALTQLGNRRAFDDEMSRRSAEFVRHQRPVCVTMIDVDHFKKFNDTYGHQAGDAVLRGVADMLRDTMREMDVICRYGGEEFAVIFPGTPLADARLGAARARRAIHAATFHFEGTDLRVTASLGVAQMMSGESIETTVKRADTALYAAKEAGRNGAYWHDGTNSHPIDSEAVNPGKSAPQPSADEAGEQVASVATPLPATSEETAASTAPLEISIQKPAQATKKTKPVAPPVAVSPPTAANRQAADCPLNGLATPEAFRYDISRRVTEIGRGGATFSVVLFEVDELDAVTQRHGDNAADVLRVVAAELIRAGAGDMADVARFDENVFGVMLIGEPLEMAMQTAERIRAAVERWDSDGHWELEYLGERFTMTVSAGVAEVSADETGDKVIGRAETALDSAIGRGRNRCFSNQHDPCGQITEEATSTL